MRQYSFLLRFIFLRRRHVDPAVVFDSNIEQIGTATHFAIFSEPLMTLGAFIDEDFVFLAAKRAEIRILIGDFFKR